MEFCLVFYKKIHFKMLYAAIVIGALKLKGQGPLNTMYALNALLALENKHLEITPMAKHL